MAFGGWRMWYRPCACSSWEVRVLLTAPVGGSYAAKAIRILSAPLKMAVQDCAEASMHGDARDLFFPTPAPEFDPLSSAPMRGTAPLLEGALRQLGQYTAELSALKPKIEACKKASFLGGDFSFLALEAKAGEAPRYQQQHRKTTDGRLCAPASAQDEQTFTGCSSLASPDGSVGLPWYRWVRLWLFVRGRMRVYWLVFAFEVLLGAAAD